MQFKEVSDEQMAGMQFSGGKGGRGKSPYSEALQAVKGGKRILISLEEGKQMRNLRWSLSQAAKRAEMKIDIKTLADKTGVVVSLAADEQTYQAGAEDTGAEPPATTTRARK